MVSNKDFKWINSVSTLKTLSCFRKHADIYITGCVLP